MLREFASLSPTDQASTIGSVDGIFSGDKALPYDGLGKVKLEQAKTIRVVKGQQVQTILARAAAGTITQEQAEAQLKSTPNMP
ncbi:MAG: hypothetical protein H6799_00775 [Candidatus Nomurabacteria bacterium]|nr:MAG: hypothetical protein H6799_00775 [Candidatus Nomurabacteria bacterium]